ncbi:MAG: M20/M25/M40 family metallo-hydrolase [Deltaproteobacteria bacterium]|nr:M20/M25/M40 family metallo-hydrolase [Deltaproteobacteria bacterium]
MGKNAFLASSHLIVQLQSLYKKFPVRNRLFNPPESTFQPTRKEANHSSINTIPGEDVFYMDCRVLPQYDLKEVMKTVRLIADSVAERFGITIDVESVQSVQAPPPTPATAAVVRALKLAIRDVYQVKGQTVGIGAGTVAAVFRKYGYEAAVWSKLRYKAHQPDESCLISNMVGNAKVFAHLMMQS